MDEEYAELCQPIEEANKRLTDAWQAEWSALAAKYQRLCKRIDDENYRQLAAWRRRCVVAKYDEECREIHAINQQLMMKWEAVDRCGGRSMPAFAPP